MGTLAFLIDDPFVVTGALKLQEHGALAVGADGRILAADSASSLSRRFPTAVRVDHGEAWLIPGMIDAHVHFPQCFATASRGRNLIDWLEQRIFPAEMALLDDAVASTAAAMFVERLVAGGTTTAMVFGSQFPAANDALLASAKQARLRMTFGPTLMDCGGPEALLQSPEAAAAAIEQLMGALAGDDRLRLAITPRFALSCSAKMLQVCGELARQYPDLWIQTHINESTAEIDAVRNAFAYATDYFEVYERFGLADARTMLAHNLHVSDGELSRMHAAGCAVCHCPASNLYLGSGLFPLMRHVRAGVPLALGTDIGAGNRFSVWAMLPEVFKVQQLQNVTLDVAELLYLATLGGARAMGLDAALGSFSVGKRADFIVLDPSSDDYLSMRLGYCTSLEDQLFCLMNLADERHIREVIIDGEPALPVRMSAGTCLSTMVVG